jgi:putative flippase GtrA
MDSKMRIDLVAARQFLKFSGVGAANTLIHLAVTVSLVELWQTNPVIANTLAFLTANAFSYWANSRWSFRAEMSRQRFIRFFIVSIVGLLLTITLSGFAQEMHWHYLVGVALMFCALPVLTFVFHKYLTFPST